MRAPLVLAIVVLSIGPAVAGKSCYFTDADNTCINKEDVEPIHLLKKGVPYASARQQLMRLGYTPGRIPGAEKVRCDGPCTTPPEMLGCDHDACRFLMEKGQSYYVVHTRGTDYRYVGASFMSDQEHAQVMARQAD